jgi:hypothetical protein
VLGALDLDGGDRGALEGGEQHAPEAVAHGGAEAALEGLDGETAEGVALELGVGDDPGGQLHTAPANSHG